MKATVIRGVLSGLLWFATAYYGAVLADFSGGLTVESIMVLLAAVAAQAAVLAIRVPGVDNSRAPPSGPPDQGRERPLERIHARKGVESGGNIVLGDDSEGSTVPARDTDRDIQIGDDVRAKGDITFGNRHTDGRRR